MATDQLFLMDCYIKDIQVHYNKLPFFKSNKWCSRTLVNFNLFEHSKLEVQETNFSEKGTTSSVVFDKGASCLFGLREEQLLELSQNLVVTVTVSDEIKGTNEKIDLATKNIILPLCSTDLIHGMTQDLSSNETKVTDFCLHKMGQLIVHMTGFLRVTFLGQRIITHFYFSKALNNMLYCKEAHGESSALSNKSNVSQEELMRRILLNLKAQQKEAANVDARKMKDEAGSNRNKCIGDKNSCLHIVNDFTKNIKKENNTELETITDYRRGVDQQTERLNNIWTSAVKTAEIQVAPNLSPLHKTVQEARLEERLKIESIIKSKSSNPSKTKLNACQDDLSLMNSISPYINFIMRDEKNFFQKTASSCTCQSQATLATQISSPKESMKERSATRSSSNGESGPPQQHGSINSPCPCLLEKNRLTNLFSCVCVNKKKDLTSGRTADTEKHATDLNSCLCVNKREKDDSGVQVFKPNMDFHSCPCMANKIAADHMISSLHSCVCNLKSTDLPLQIMGVDLLSCDCMLQKTDQATKPLTLFSKISKNMPSDKINNPHSPTNPCIVYSCACMLNRGMVEFNNAQENRAYACRCTHEIAGCGRFPAKVQDGMYSCTCMTKLATADRKNKKTENVTEQTQISSRLCECKEKLKKSQLADTDKNGFNNTRQHDDTKQCRELIDKSFESGISGPLNDEYNIFIPEIAAEGNGTSLIQTMDKDQNKKDNENLEYPQLISKKPTQKQVPILELPFDSQTDIYLIHINRTKIEDNCHDKTEPCSNVPIKPLNQSKRVLANNGKSLCLRNDGLQTLQTHRKDKAKLAPRTSVLKTKKTAAM